MRYLFTLCLFCFALLTQPALAQTATTLSGTVLDTKGTAQPGANVFLKGTFDGASTDANGRFQFSTQQPAGAAVLVVSMLGLETQEQAVQLGAGAVRLPAIKLREARHELGDVVIAAGAFEASDEKRSAALKPLDIVTTAGALGDIAGALNTLPGTTRVGDEGKLFVRGGTAGEVRTYIDGLPVQNPYGSSVPQVAARGRFSPFLFKGTTFSTGGYSAEYGQALSAVVGLQTTDLAPETQSSISLMSVGASVGHTQRWDHTSLGVSADYVNLTPYFALVPQRWGWDKAPQSQGGSVNFQHRTPSYGMLKVYGTFSQQQLALRQPDPNPLYAENGRPVTMRSGNQYLNVTYRSPLSRGWSVQTGAALSNDQNTLRPDTSRLHDRERVAVGRVVLTNDSAGTRWNLKLGAEALVQDYRQQYQAASTMPLWTLGFTEKRGAAFVESDVLLSNRVSARVGLRSEYSGLLNRGSVAPRVALAWQVGSYSQLSAAGGLFYQNPSNDLLRVSRHLDFERARHYVLTYQYVNNNRTLRLETYHKQYAHLATFNGAAPLQASAYASNGAGYARGAEVFWRDRQTFKKLDYWVSYGFIDTKRRFRDEPVLAQPTFAARHNLSVVSKYWVQQIHTQFSATYAFTSGRPFTNPNVEGYRQALTPAVHDLSLNASYLTTWFKQFTIVHVAVSNVLGNQPTYGYNYAATPGADGQYARTTVTSGARRMVFVGVFIAINKKKVNLDERPD